MVRIKLILLLLLATLLSSCAASYSAMDKQIHCKPVKNIKHKMVKCSYSILLIVALAILSSCNVMNTIVGTDYWNEVCFEDYAYYDSSGTYHKQWLIDSKTYVYVTDLTDERQCIVIWGDECKFTPGELLKIKWTRSHSATVGTNGWRASLVDNHFHYSYHIFK